MNLDSQAVVDELGRGRWADRRLARRARAIGEGLIANPALSFPKAFSSSADLEGAYRFFGNPLVEPDAILDGHFAATRQRAMEEQSVLVIHDTTTCSFREDGEREGLGRVRTTGQAYFAHVGLVLSDDSLRRPLGVAYLKTWTRSDEKTTPGSERARWSEGVDVASARLVGAKLIHVMDREADDYALLSHLVTTSQCFVIRALHNRILEDDHGSRRKLDEVVAQIEEEVERGRSYRRELPPNARQNSKKFIRHAEHVSRSSRSDSRRLFCANPHLTPATPSESERFRSSRRSRST